MKKNMNISNYEIELVKKTIAESGMPVQEAATGIIHKYNGENRESFQIMIIDGDVEAEGKKYRVLSVEKWIYDTEDIEAVDHVEVLSFDVWEI